MRGGPGLLTIVYLVIGAFVAGSHNYFQNLNTLEAIVSALLAIALWPLVLLNVNLHVNF
jgi:hypothetical protein